MQSTEGRRCERAEPIETLFRRVAPQKALPAVGESGLLTSTTRKNT